MGSSLDQPPKRVHCEADLHSATITLKPTRSVSSWLVLFLVAGFTLGMLGLAANMMMPDVWFLVVLLLSLIIGLWLLSQRSMHATHIILNANLLDIRRSRFGAHYRIPLVDITDVTLHSLPSKGGTLRLHMADDTIIIGESCTYTQLIWLKDILQQSTTAARQRPAQREGLPEDVPHVLRTMRSNSIPPE
jgi:hypothetical protein